MFRTGTPFSDAVRFSASHATALILGVCLLAIPGRLLAQHGGGGHGMPSGGGGGGAGRPSGVSEKDDLKDFHRAMALQANAEQRAAFAKIAQYTQAASDQLQALRESLQKASGSSPLSDGATTLDQAIERARAGNQNFLSSLTAAQKSGLQDITKKLAKADAELEKQVKTLDQNVHTPKPDSEHVANSAVSLDKELASFQNEQLALGREMGILIDEPGLAFNLPTVTNSIKLAGQPVSIPASGTATRTSAENGLDVFSLRFTADLSDLQQNISGILRAILSRSPRCGERIQIQQATLTPMVPASLVVTSFHYERWICSDGSGLQHSGSASPTEVADTEATIEVKITPSIEPSKGLTVASEITRVEAEGFLRNLLRSGDLGTTLREQISSLVLDALQKAVDLKSTLPTMAQPFATIQKAQFQDAGADQLNLVLEGQLQFSDEQAKQFAAQLKQKVSAQGTRAP